MEQSGLPDAVDVCLACERQSEDADREGWHVFSDGADEEYALCPVCARANVGSQNDVTSVR
jgi:hypothetical protein